MRAISGYYPYHARQSTASSAQLDHKRVVGGGRKCRKPRKTHESILPTTKFPFVPEKSRERNESVCEKITPGRKMLCSIGKFSLSRVAFFAFRLLLCAFFSTRSIFVSDGNVFSVYSVPFDSENVLRRISVR